VFQSNHFNFSHINTFVFDLDGVVYLGDQPISDAPESINALMTNGKSVYFLTNNSSVTRLAYVSKLERMGIHIDEPNVYTSAYATGLYLQAKGASGSNAFVIGESGVQQEISAVGVNVFTDPSSVSSAVIDYVVVGIDRSFTYEKLNFGHECVVRGHAELIATNRDSTYPSEIGTVPGAGSIVMSVASSTGREPITIGKPEPTALLEIIGKSNDPKDTFLMVGDRLDTDIACGSRAGVRTALVLTGVTSRSSAEAAFGDEKPTYIIGSLKDLL
jgi:4-nitrophenyl phosphatase